MCTLLFAPGTWKLAPSGIKARATLSRGRLTFAYGSGHVSRGDAATIALHATRPLRPGTYLMTVTVVAPHRTTTWRHAIRLH